LKEGFLKPRDPMQRSRKRSHTPGMHSQLSRVNSLPSRDCDEKQVPRHSVERVLFPPKKREYELVYAVCQAASFAGKAVVSTPAPHLSP
jgi:hypothetical protein